MIQDTVNTATTPTSLGCYTHHNCFVWTREVQNLRFFFKHAWDFLVQRKYSSRYTWNVGFSWEGKWRGHESDVIKHLLNQECCREGLPSEMREAEGGKRGQLANEQDLEEEQEFLHRGRAEKQPQSQERTQVACPWAGFWSGVEEQRGRHYTARQGRAVSKPSKGNNVARVRNTK